MLQSKLVIGAPRRRRFHCPASIDVAGWRTAGIR
jgi:hypothetical protein